MAFHPPVAIVAKAGDAGKYKVGLPSWNMVLRGFFSGAFIAMGAGLATVCSTGITSWRGRSGRRLCQRRLRCAGYPTS